MKKEHIQEIFCRFARLQPEPQTELEYTNPYTLLVAVTLSAQATDASVNKATRGLFKVVDCPEKMLELGMEGLIGFIKTIGLYNAKAKNIITAAEILMRDYRGQVPQDRLSLETLPGVGRKTANVVLNVTFGQPTIAVDTHIFRVANRIGLAQGKTPLAVELKLEKIIPKQYLAHAHHWLILHGRYICKARKPLCPSCPIADLCQYPDKIKAAA